MAAEREPREEGATVSPKAGETVDSPISPEQAARKQLNAMRLGEVPWNGIRYRDAVRQLRIEMRKNDVDEEKVLDDVLAYARQGIDLARKMGDSKTTGALNMMIAKLTPNQGQAPDALPPGIPTARERRASSTPTRDLPMSGSKS